MIIAINGKIGVGKDTVGEIIQKLCAINNGPEFEIRKFAGKLKTIASLLTGILVEKFEDQEFKKTNLSDEWSSVQQSERSKVWLPMTVRELLQKLGTEAMRDGLHENVWVNALFADYTLNQVWKTAKELNSEVAGSVEEYPNWIITDMRFPNEMEAIVARGGITIRVVRPDFIENALTGQKFPVKVHRNLHASETALDGHTMHYDIINDGTIEDLIEKVKEILIKENII